MNDTETIDDIIGDAIMWSDTLEQADADAFVVTLLDRIVGILRRDQRMPRLSYEQWHLLFADAAARSRAELGELICNKGDVVEAADAIADALADKIAESRPQRATTAAAE